MADNEIMIPGVENVSDIQKFAPEVLDAITSAAFLPRLQLMIATSEPCKNGDFPINHYALVRSKNSMEDLGDSVDLFVVTWRPKALKIDETVFAVYDPKLGDDGKPTGDFARIMIDSEKRDSGCMYGPEYLVWIPQIKEFATFFMGSKSSRRESPLMSARCGKMATLKSKLIPGKKYKWFAPSVFACSTPPDEANMPSAVDIKTEVDKFNNPPESEVETASDDEAESQERAR